MITFKRIKNSLTIKIVSYATIIFNLIALIFSIVYLVLASRGIVYVFVLWDIFGVIMLIAFFNNLLLIYIINLRLSKTIQLGNRLNIICYTFLIFVIFGMLLIYLGNWSYFSIYSTNPDDAINSYVYICVGYFGILLFGMFIALFCIKNLNNRDLWDLNSKGSLKQSNKTLKIKTISKKLLRIGCYLTLIIGIYISYAVIFGSVELVAWVVLFLLSGIIVFIALIFLSITILLLKITDKNKSPNKYYAVGFIGLLITAIMMLPLCFTPYSVYNAEKNFAEAFGNDWRGNIDADLEEKYFLNSPFWIAGYFLSMPAKDCEYKADVMFFDGEESNYSQDEDITLLFDVFWPKEIKNEMPGVKAGKCAILIVIHGGGHRMGSKGGSQIYMNKYFAAQGYVVYDIEYGLRDEGFSERGEGINVLPTPEYVKGDFDVNDMVRHIGNLTQYISNPSNKYSADDLDANLDSVFITGGSAGGHLTAATALGISSKQYPKIFGEIITIKGMIPLYPGRPNFKGKDEFVAPEEHLIDKNSPPCLIYQGTHDYGREGEQTKRYSKEYKKAYEEAGKEECCIIWLPFSGHAGDVWHRTGQYNQVFTYYMERFMYLCVEGYIKN
jgi:dienelactone hydrolase